MNKTFNIVLALLLSMILGSCMDEDIEYIAPANPQEGRIVASLNLLVPLSERPSSRAINNDSKISDFTIWVFNNNLFVEAVRPGDQFVNDKGELQNKITFTEGEKGRLEIALKKEMTSITLMMIANTDVTDPSVGATWDEVQTKLKTTTYQYTGAENYMPMYGVSSEPFAAKQGEKGFIQLKRTMAKIVINTQKAQKQFKLKKVYVYNVNQTGFIESGGVLNSIPSWPSLNDPSRFIEGQVVNNVGTVYVPELANIAQGTDGTTRTSVILEGDYSSLIPNGNGLDVPVTKYYRLEFVKLKKNAAGISEAVHLNTLERNHCYTYNIEFFADGIGTTDPKKVLTNVADNVSPNGAKVDFMVFDDLRITSITTDNYIYLGVISDSVQAVVNTDGTHYTAQINVTTNNPEGWAFGILPNGVSTTLDKWVPSPTDVTCIQSLWAFFDKSYYAPNSEEYLYIYSGKIRKRIKVKMPSDIP